MIRLKAFVDERLSTTAVEILVEVEKTIALYQVEVSRSRDEIGLLRKELSLLKEKADPLQAHGTIVKKESNLILQQNLRGPSPSTGKEEESDPIPAYEVPGTSQTDVTVEDDDWNYCTIQTDFEISEVKKEEEEFGIVSGETEAEIPLAIGESDRDQPDSEFEHGSLPFPSKLAAAQSENGDSDEDWAENKARTSSKKWKSKKAKVVKRQMDSNKQVELTKLPYQNSPEKPQSDHSFCHLCGKAFQYIGSLMKHIKMHDKTHDCNVCGKAFQSSEELISHLQTAHSNTHFCDVCGKTFSKSHFLTAHAKIHTGVKPYTCQDCGKAFVRKEHLVVHARTHSGEKPYHCDICGKAFSQSQNLTIHKRSHTGEKPYHCGLCGKLFSTSNHLKTHMRYHSGEKPYSCKICGKNFSQNGQMTRHMRTHTGERPYGCHVCGMRYKFAPNLKEHMKIHERETAS